MHIVDDIINQHFLECQLLITELNEIKSADALISNKSKVERLYECVAVLKSLSDNKERLVTVAKDEIGPDPQVYDSGNLQEVNVLDKAEYELSSESRFEFAQSEESNLNFSDHTYDSLTSSIQPDTDLESTKILSNSSEILPDFENPTEPLASASEEQEINVAGAVHNQDAPSVDHVVSEYTNGQSTIEAQEHHQEKKMKLAHIKALKSVPSLFDQEAPVQEPTLVQAHEAIENPQTSVPNKLQRTAFKLDLNDRIAFTKILFDGSQSSLNEAVGRLNTFDSLEEAKEFLSELYYERNWENSDEYAQRLWSLVESKFY